MLCSSETTNISDKSKTVHIVFLGGMLSKNRLVQEFRDFLAKYPDEFVVKEEIVFLKEYEGKITNTFRNVRL